MTESTTSTQLKALPEGAIEGLDILGRGYDIFGKYADRHSLKPRLFDWNKGDDYVSIVNMPDKVAPKIVDVIQAAEFQYSNHSGTTMTSFLESFSLDFNFDFGLFSGELNQSQDTKKLYQSTYTRIQQTVSLWQLSIRPDLAQLRQRLDDDFQTALNNANTDSEFDDLFDQYGSHFLSGIVIGGCAGLYYEMDREKLSHGFSLQASAQANFEISAGTVSGNVKAKYGKASEKFSEHISLSKIHKGGNVDLAEEIYNGQYQQWQRSIPSDPVFCDFRKENALTPIWLLCDDPQKQNSMQHYFNEIWGPRTSYNTHQHPNFVEALTVIVGYDTNPPAQYDKIPTDLNKGFGGYYLYLCVKKTPVLPGYDNKAKNANCIVDITFVSANEENKAKAKVPQGYQYIDVDLNKGVDDIYIYLCYKTAPYDPKLAITDIKVMAGKDGDKVEPPLGYTLVDANLNGPHSSDESIYLSYLNDA